MKLKIYIKISVKESLRKLLRTVDNDNYCRWITIQRYISYETLFM
jgi:hypothetical protein